MTEWIGLVGSVLVAVSLMMTNIWRLRWINLIGALFFTVYGLLLHAWPVFAVNAFISVIDVWYLVQMASDRVAFSAIDVTAGDREFLRRFISFHDADIQRYFPGFDVTAHEDARFVFVLRNMLPVGLFVYAPRDEGVVEVIVDYVIPAYRDFENGAFLYSSRELLRTQACRSFVARTADAAHKKYLRRMGFKEESVGVFRRPEGPHPQPPSPPGKGVPAVLE